MKEYAKQEIFYLYTVTNGMKKKYAEKKNIFQ